MKKIINGKKYDTETAKKIDCASSMYLKTSFSYWEESLYQKRNGEFFLYGEGGPSSKYSVHVSENEWYGGEKIIPLTEQEAKQWAEQHMSVNKYEEIFGEVEE